MKQDPDYDPAPAEWRLSREALRPGASADLEDVVFSLSNGFFGCRGTRPFCPKGTRGTYVNGLYAEGPAEAGWIPPPGDPARDMARFPTDEDVQKVGRKWVLVAAPNLFAVDVLNASGRGADAAFHPTLDLRSGLLCFEGSLQAGGVTWQMTTLRFVSRRNPALAVERIVLAADAPGAELALFLALDDSVRTWRGARAFDLWQERAAAPAGDSLVLWRGATRGRNMQLRIAFACVAQGAEVGLHVHAGMSGFRVQGRGRMVIDRFVAVASSAFHADPDTVACQTAAHAAAGGFCSQLEDHVAAWRDLWRQADVQIEGPAADQQAVRYAIFQVAASAPDTDQVSIGAKFLSGEGYYGMVFWDMELFVLPFLIRALPHHARRHLEFRYRGLRAAREKAAAYGFRGAMYPWQAAPTGEEGVAPWVILDRTQVHIVADVAWGVAEYYRWTRDEAFMDAQGREILAECARFWASRADPATGGILDVCGPDESRPRVNNNAFTNHMARQCLLWAAEHAQAKAPAAEVQAWRALADRLVQKLPGANGVIEQADGFLAAGESAPIKQADVMMLPMLFPDELTPEQIRANYLFYEPRTGHRSSLSEGPHAVAAALAGMPEQAYDFFSRCARMDLHDLHGDTAGEGLHAACMGIVPTVVAAGFCGLRLRGDEVFLHARLPASWKSVAFKFVCRGRERAVHLRNGEEQRFRV